MSTDLTLPEGRELSRPELRQKERLPNGYKDIALAGMTFDPRLTFELALGLDDSGAIFARYGYDHEAAIKLIKQPVFQHVLKAYVDDVKENGLTYKNKAKLQAEVLLVDAFEIARDPEAPAAVRADLIKWHAKVADYEPKQNAPQAAGNGFALQIVFSGEARKEPLLVQGETINQRADE
jgi:hypothetical protein